MSTKVDVRAEQNAIVEQILKNSNSHSNNNNRPTKIEDAEYLAGYLEAQADYDASNRQYQEEDRTKGLSALQRLRKLSISSKIEDMKNMLGNEVHVFEGLAVEGQITLFYAWPNTGKTLIFFHLLIERIRQGLINPEDIFYINADDNYRGLVNKGEIARQHGFEMISPTESGQKPAEIIEMLKDLAKSPESKGKIVVLDTVKKFVNLMSKGDQSKFYSDLRTIAMGEITIILAGHANKYADSDGNLIYEGTADTLNDIDCVYSINRLASREDDEMTVEFKNEKNRGDVVKSMSFKYDNRQDILWTDRLASVTLLADTAAGNARRERLENDKKGKHESALYFVSALLKGGTLNQSEITLKHSEYVKQPGHELHALAHEVSARSLKTALKQLDGIAWTTQRGIKNNELNYTLSDHDGSRYKQTKNGE